MNKQKIKKHIIVSAFATLAAITGAYKFINGYLVKMTWNEDGTGQGTMKTPDITDIVIFWIIVLIGLIGFVFFVVNLVKFFRNS